MARMAKKGKVVRLNLEIREEVRDKLERLQDMTQADSMTEVIRRALAVYYELWSLKEGGFDILVKRDMDITKLLLI